MWWCYSIFLFIFGKQLITVDAFSFFQGTGAKIVQDVILLYSNSTSIDRTFADFSPIFYNENINPLTNNMEHIGETGLKGVLYDQGFSCSTVMTNASNVVLPSPFFNTTPIVESKVALIKSEGQCSLLDQIRNAQMDGAHACLVYASMIQTPNFEIPQLNLNDGNVSIPVFYIHKQIGQSLYKQLSDLANDSHPLSTDVLTNVTAKRVVRVQLFPPIGGTPNPWEITILILIIILTVGFMSSVCLQLYLWRRQKKLQRLIESGALPPTPDMLPMNKLLLTSVKLDLFPTRIITEEDYDMAKKKKDDSNRDTSNRSNRLSSSSHQSASDENTCVICLDALEIGQKIRELPCLHEYHCDCIDPWLTSKSGECPLCKFDCVRHVTTPEEQKATDETHAYYTNTDINVLHVVTQYVKRRFAGSSPPTTSPSP